MARKASASLDILYEDNHLLVVSKPAGVATMGAPAQPTVHSLAAEYLRVKYAKRGRAYVGVVSRLDAMTTGVQVLARTSKAASRLSAQFAQRGDPGTSKGNDSQPPEVVKLYLAAVEGRLAEPCGRWVDSVLKDDRAKRMRVVDSKSPGAQLAKLSYLTLACDARTTLLAIRLHSGRKHQIRVQSSDRGHPVLGDRKYRSSRPFEPGIALHSWRLRIAHPTRRESMWFEASLPPSWRGLGSLTASHRDWGHVVDTRWQLADDPTP